MPGVDAHQRDVQRTLQRDVRHEHLRSGYPFAAAEALDAHDPDSAAACTASQIWT